MTDHDRGDHDDLPDDEHVPSKMLLETLTPADAILFYATVMLATMRADDGIAPKYRKTVDRIGRMSAANFEARDACPLCVMKAIETRYTGLGKHIRDQLGLQVKVLTPEQAEVEIKSAEAMLSDAEPDQSARDTADAILARFTSGTQH